MRTLHAALLALGTMALTTGCLSEQRFMTPEGGGLWLVAVDEDTPAFIETEDGNIYIVEQRIEFQFREPTAEEVAEQGMTGGLSIPYAQLPWLQRGDYAIQVDYTVSNLDPDVSTEVTITLNGINEFHEYSPSVQIVDEDLVADFSGWEHTVRLGPGARFSGTIREEEVDEIAVDLATVVNGAPNANQIVYFENQSFNDRRSQMYIPDVVPALTGVRVGLRTTSNSPVVLEATVRIRDERGVLVQGDDQPWPLPAPALFSPADAAAAAMMAAP